MLETGGMREDLVPEFEILGELGRGGVSVVYLARDRMLGRQVALKVIDDRYVGDSDALSRFRREARLLAKLQHANIVPVYAARRLRDGRVALVMQHMQGPTLRQLLRREGALSPEQTRRVLTDVGEALAYLHRRGIVHRDVKPENVYVDPDGARAYLSDFGIAKPVDADSGLTLSGVVLGTPTYMSPEQVDGSWLNGQSDLYSLGMVGWEMLSGQRPWAGEALYTVIYKQKNENLPSLARLRPDIPESLREAVERALLKDRALRWPNVEAFLQQLRGPALPVKVSAGSMLPVPVSGPVPVPVSPLALEDLPTRMIRPAQVVDEVWREASAVARERTLVRRRRLAAVTIVAGLSIGALMAAAALFARMRDLDPFVAAPATEVTEPARDEPRAPPATISPETEPPSGTAPAADSAPSPAASDDGMVLETAARVSPPARRRDAGRPPARTATASPSPRAAPPAEAPRAPPRLLGTPLGQEVRTEPVRLLGEPRIREAPRGLVVIPRR